MGFASEVGAVCSVDCSRCSPRLSKDSPRHVTHRASTIVNPPIEWGHASLAALNHDIGYVRGICPGDTEDRFVIDAAGKTVTPPRGASDAFLKPYHVERRKIMVRAPGTWQSPDECSAFVASSSGAGEGTPIAW